MSLILWSLRNFRISVPQLGFVLTDSKDAPGLTSFAALIVFWTLGEHLKSARNEIHSTKLPPLQSASGSSSASLAVVEAIKLASVGLAYLRSKEGGVLGRRDDESRGYLALHPERQGSHVNGGSYGRPSVLTAIAAVLFAVQNYVAVFAETVSDPITLYLVFAFVTMFSLFIMFSALGRPFASLHWQAALLQACGLFIAHTAFDAVKSNIDSFPVLLSFVLSRSLALVLISYIYTTHRFSSLNTLHLHLFASGLSIHLIVSIFQQLFISPAPPVSPTFSSDLQLSDILSLFCQAFADLASLTIIHDYDAVVEGLTRSVGAACFVLYYCVFHTLNMRAVIGCFIVFVGLFANQGRASGEFPEKSYSSARLILSVVTFASLSLYAIYAVVKSGLPVPLQRVPSVAELLTSSKVSCIRNPLPLGRMMDENRVYHAFDNILLIVFFSHARYDVNLDYYRSTYEEFFPNMVFIGPASREDKGFAHSYDILVDSYQSDEDLNSDPNYYKMAGRESFPSWIMAHHMLYTAITENPCYDGYLWAPFDTLLNLPRLQQFDQRNVWYHSPFGKYVPNPALGEGNSNVTRHPPPANISPDPAINLTETWRGWGPDWWWGDPHVGLSVCMQAFDKVPLHMRTRLASLTNGTRFIGGSADTLYIPRRYVEDFMKVLGLFLETNCFLEIATPTALHLVVAPDDDIQYVDHWWIWQPPFNASFVRQKWTEGFEVDTFHTFHWGDLSEDGAWKGNHANIADVRELLVESATRQQVYFPHLAWDKDA